MDVSLLTLVLDRLVPGSAAMTPAALKHAQSKHSRVGSEGVIPQRVCSALAAASPLLSKGLWAHGASPAPRPAPETESLWRCSRATVSEGSPRETSWSFKGNELYLVASAWVMRSHLPSSGGFHVPSFPSSPRDNFVPMISNLLVFTSQLHTKANGSHIAKLRAISTKAPGSCAISQ